MSEAISHVEISRSRLVHNIRQFRQAIGPRMLIACVVKGNAYGHGLRQVVGCLDQEVDYFQVDDLDELERLRDVNPKPVLVLGYISNAQMARALELRAELAVFDPDQLAGIAAASHACEIQARIHVELDSFLGRQGIVPDQIAEFCGALRSFPAIELAGVYAHFANIEDTADRSHSRKQIEAFAAAQKIIRSYGFDGFATHISSTAGTLVHELEGGRNDLIRIGIGTYGLYPSVQIQQQFPEIELQPAMRWISRIAQVKVLPAGYPIGYGLTFVTVRPTRVAIVPQGYSDGFNRRLSNSGSVLIQGRRCAVLGRVSMNMITVDVSTVPQAGVGDEVVLLGEQGSDRISAEEIAELIGSINYEVVAAISPLLPRFVVS